MEYMEPAKKRVISKVISLFKRIPIHNLIIYVLETQPILPLL